MLHGVHSMADLRFVLGEVETVYMVEHKAASSSAATWRARWWAC